LPVLYAALLILLSGVVTSIYVLMVKQLTTSDTSQDSVEQAATYVAHELSKIGLSHERLGNVGILDTAYDAKNKSGRLSGISAIYASLRAESLVAQRLHLPYLQELIQTDFEDTRRLESELGRVYWEAVEPNFHVSDAGGESHSIYQSAYHLAGQGALRDESIVDVKLELGTLKGGRFTSSQAAAQPDITANEVFVKGGQYAAGVDIPLAGSQSSFTMYPLSDNATELVSPSLFISAAKGNVPSAVLLEASYKSVDPKTKTEVLRKRRACVLIGGPRYQYPAAVFLLSFPQGTPPMFSSLADIINYKGWRQRGGWQQAEGGPVPGAGHLVPPQDIDYGSDSCFEAVQVVLYHWLRAAGPGVDPEKVETLLKQRWPTVAVGDNINSALCKDTGLRTYALKNLTNADGAGQDALANAFAADPVSTKFPQSALPLQIDSDGNCNLPSRQGFDSQLVRDYMRALHDTNVSAIESRALARAIIARLDKANQELDEDIRIAAEELASVSNRVESLTTEGGSPQDKQASLLKRSRNELSERLEKLKRNRAEYQTIRHRAEIVLNNADRAAASTYDLCANAQRFGHDGLFYVEAPVHGFLINKSLVFIPEDMAASEADIYKSSILPTTRRHQSWCNASFSTLAKAPDGLIVEGRTLAELKAETAKKASARPVFAVLDTAQLKADNPQLRLLERSPFGAVGVPRGQLAYYAADTLVTGKDINVGWSLLLRDLVAFQGSEGLGEPVASTEPRWCQGQEIGMTTCPGLAVELQVRAPTPLMSDLPTVADLVNPISGASAVQIPPMPAQML
jgi:hypothetical protein